MGKQIDKNSLTQLLQKAGDGNEKASVQLFGLAYEELKRMAHHKLRKSGVQQTLHTTALVHEAYIKLFNHGKLKAENRIHFFALCGKIMRQIVVDHYRKKLASKRGGDQQDQTLKSYHGYVADPGAELIDLDSALTRLEELNSRLATVVECKFFVAMKDDEIASYLGVTDRTVRNDWRKARMWLSRELASTP